MGIRTRYPTRNRMRDREGSLKEWVRLQLLDEWDEAGEQATPIALQRISGDASFRTYYRAQVGARSWVAVDAPPAEEDSRPFVAVAELLRKHGVNVPRVFAADLDEGFMLLSDLGDDLYLDRIGRDTDTLYGDAIDALLEIQSITLKPAQLPLYDRALLMREMELFPEWMVTRQLGLTLSRAERAMLDALFATLAGSALEQPQVFVHRDYHSRNLMVTRNHNPGIVDFQDAVIGALTYDLVSLLRDCYVEWPEPRVQHWVSEYLARREAAGHTPAVAPEQFLRWFDLMGLQRHIKVAGIFCRLHLRDGKALYLRDIPLVMRYILKVAVRYPELDHIVEWLGGRVLPPMAGHQELFGDLKEQLGSYL